MDNVRSLWYYQHMMPGWAIVLILAVVGLSALAGALVTWFVQRVVQRKTGGDEKSVDIPSPQEIEEALEQEESPVVPVAPISVEHSPICVERPVSVLSVRKSVDDNLEVYVQGKQCSHLKDIADAEIGYSVIEALKAIFAFTEGWFPATARPGDATAIEPAPAEQKFVGGLEHHNGFASRRTTPSPTDGQHTLAERINVLVQERLETRSDLASLHIQIGSSSSGALFIRVGSHVFDSVDSISHVEARGIIQEVIQDWERSR